MWLCWVQKFGGPHLLDAINAMYADCATKEVNEIMEYQGTDGIGVDTLEFWKKQQGKIPKYFWLRKEIRAINGC